MATLIPSKNIFDMDNPKIVDNDLDRFEIDAVLITPNNNANENVFGVKTSISSKNSSTQIDEKIDTNVYQSGGMDYFSAAYASYKDKKTTTIELRVPIQKDISIVETINSINVALYGIIKKGTATATVQNNSISNLSKGTPTETSSEAEIINFPTNITAYYNGAYNYPDAFVSVDLKDIGNTKDFTYEKVKSLADDKYYFAISLNVMCDLTTYNLTGATNYTTGTTLNSMTISGEYITYEASIVEISVLGSTVGIKLDEETVILGDTNGNRPFAFDGNELMQISNTWGRFNTSSAIETLFGKTLSYYKDGLETATILCSIDDYYVYDKDKSDLKGDKIISIDNPNRMTFNIYDEVIPMIPYYLNYKTQDYPMSFYDYDAFDPQNPKVFKVIGVEFIYDGAVWQKLTLQEKPKN